jgi:peptidoglycan-N-acetylglucosamine deacetylase
MPWKDRYTISDERSLADADIKWPDGARLAVHVSLNLAPACGGGGIEPADLRTPDAHYGLHGALDTLLPVLDRHNIRLTVAVPAVIAAIHTERMRALAAAGHEIVPNGWRNEDPTLLDRAQEAERIGRATEVLTNIIGSRPRGWYSLPRPSDKFATGSVSPHTMDLLLDAGYEWFGNGLADDAPHWWVTDFASRRALLCLPYYYHFDDQFFLLFPAKGTGLEHADSLFRNWRSEFQAQYLRGRCFHMVLHPHAIAFAHRLRMLDHFLTDLRSHPGLWNPTGSSLATHWSSHHPLGELKPSIWQDHPGSLS